MSVTENDAMDDSLIVHLVCVFINIQKNIK